MKSYIKPGCRIIDLLAENMIATSPNSMSYDDTKTIENEGEFLSNQKENIWGSEGIWK